MAVVEAVSVGVGALANLGGSLVNKGTEKAKAEGMTSAGALDFLRSKQEQEAKNKRTVMYVGIGIVAIVVIGLVLLVVFKKK
jgi:hypothetical protein